MTGDERGDRPKLSWREIDQLRSGGQRRDERRPRGKAAEERSDKASQEYLKEVDKIFSKEQGGAEGKELAKAVRDAHGTTGFVDACRAYREALGMPQSPELLSLFLDTGESELVVAALETLLELQRDDRLEVSGGLRSQLRLLAEDFNASVAEVAEELLEQL